VRVGRCRDRDEAVPYLPFVEILESCVERAADDPDALRKLLGTEGPELARLMPKLRRLLSDLPAPPELSPEQARRLLFNGFCDFSARLANSGRRFSSSKTSIGPTIPPWRCLIISRSGCRSRAG